MGPVLSRKPAYCGQILPLARACPPGAVSGAGRSASGSRNRWCFWRIQITRRPLFRYRRGGPGRRPAEGVPGQPLRPARDRGSAQLAAVHVEERLNGLPADAVARHARAEGALVILPPRTSRIPLRMRFARSGTASSIRSSKTGSTSEGRRRRVSPARFGPRVAGALEQRRDVGVVEAGDHRAMRIRWRCRRRRGGAWPRSGWRGGWRKARFPRHVVVAKATLMLTWRPPAARARR